jgi:signal transduction histidine kinase
MADETAVASMRELAARLNEKIQHVNEMIAQKLEYQTKFIEQRLENIEKVNSEKLLNFSVRLEEALAEIRGYKDILQQQLTLLDSTIKKAHQRMDEMDAKGTTHSVDQIDSLRKEVAISVHEMETMMGNLKKIEEAQHDEELIEDSRKKDPIRIFLQENGKKVLLFVLAGVGLYLFKNLDGVLQFLQGAAK